MSILELKILEEPEYRLISFFGENNRYSVKAEYDDDLDEIKNPQLQYKIYNIVPGLNKYTEYQNLVPYSTRVFSKMGDIMVIGSESTIGKHIAHVMLLLSNERNEFGTKQNVLDCMSSGGCQERYLYHTNLKTKSTIDTVIIRYKGPFQEEVRKNVITFGRKMAKLSAYSMSKVCRVIFGLCKASHEKLKKIVDKYIQAVDKGEHIEHICSSFVLLCYLVGITQAFETNKKELDLAEYLSMNPRHCTPKSLVDLPSLHPKYWESVKFGYWEGIWQVGGFDIEGAYLNRRRIPYKF